MESYVAYVPTVGNQVILYTHFRTERETVVFTIPLLLNFHAVKCSYFVAFAANFHIRAVSMQ